MTTGAVWASGQLCPEFRDWIAYWKLTQAPDLQGPGIQAGSTNVRVELNDLDISISDGKLITLEHS